MVDTHSRSRSAVKRSAVKHSAGQRNTGQRSAGQHSTAYDALALVLILWHAVLLVLSLVGGETLRLWGIDAAGMIWTHPVSLVLTGAALAYVLTLRTRPMHRMLAHPATPAVLLGLVVTGLAVIALLQLGRGGVPPLLGDGALYRSEVLRLGLIPDHVPIFLKPSAMLTGPILLTLVQLTGTAHPAAPFLLLGLIALVLVVGRILLLARRHGAAGVLPFVAALLLTPAWLLLCGSIELYALPLAAVIWLLAELITAVQHDTARMTPIIIATIVALATSLSAIALLPLSTCVLAYLWCVRKGHDCSLRAAVLIAITASAVVAVAVVFRDVLGLGAYLLPPSAARYVHDGVDYGIVQYSILHPAHLADAGNMLLLVGGAWLPLAGAVLLVRRWREALPVQVLGFMLVAAASSLLTLLCANAALGMERDWDLLVVPLLMLPASAAAMLASLARRDAAAVLRILPLLVLLGGATTHAWIAVQTDVPTATDRLLRAIDRDAPLLRADFTYYGYENLRKQFRSDGDDAGVHAMYMRMLATGYRASDTYEKLLALQYNTRNVPAAWIDEVGSSLRTRIARPSRRGTHGFLDRRELGELAAQLVAQTARLGDVTRAAMWADRFAEDFAEGWKEEAFARVWLSQGATPQQTAEAVFASIDSTARSSNTLFMAAVMLKDAGAYDTAAAYLAWAIKRNPVEHPIYYLHRARLLLHVGRVDEGHAVLLACLSRCHDPARAEEARALLAQSGYIGRSPKPFSKGRTSC